ncbi:MAG: STAS domain-containing protein [Planctomycetes bacterium]|nr:STAS domain-containing protein [Planctomycetota bacterium]
MAGFEYTTRNTNTSSGIPVTVVALSGAIDPGSVETLDNLFKELLAQEQYNVVLDFQNLKYMNSTAMGLLVRWADKFAEQQGRLILLQIPTRVMMMLEMLGLKEFFKITTEEKAAVASFEVLGEGEEEIVEMHLKTPDNKTASTTSREEEAAPQPPGNAGLPPVVTETACGQCGITLTMGGPGRYRCPRCRAFLTLTPEGKVETSPQRSANEIELILPAKADYLGSLEQVCLTAAGQAGMEQTNGVEFFKALAACGNYLITEALGGVESERVHIQVQATKGMVSARLFAAGKVLPLETSTLPAVAALSEAAGNLDKLEFFANNKGNFFILEKHTN